MTNTERMTNQPNPEKPSPSITIRVIEREELEARLDEIATQMAAVASDGFGPEKHVSPARMKQRLQKEPYVVLAQEGSEVVGFQFQSLHQTDTERYLYYARTIKKDRQRRGIAQKLLQTAIDHYQPTIVGARSQNPGEILSFIHALGKQGITTVYPFVNPAEKANLTETLTEFLTELGFLEATTLETGVIPQSYPEGKLGDYAIETDNPEVKTLEEYLAAIGFDRLNGDALFYCARVKASLTAENEDTAWRNHTDQQGRPE